MQIADRGDPQPQRAGRQRFFAVRPVALGGEEGGDVGRPGGQRRQAVSAAPGAPGADTGAVGAARVVRLGVAGEDFRGLLRGGQRAVGVGDRAVHGGVEPGAHGGRWRAERRVGDRGIGQEDGMGAWLVGVANGVWRGGQGRGLAHRPVRAPCASPAAWMTAASVSRAGIAANRPAAPTCRPGCRPTCVPGTRG